MLKNKGFYRGINLGGWLSQCDYSEDRLNNFITESDFAKIASWELDHVRIPIDYNILENEDGSFKESGFARIDWALEMCHKYGLNTVLDLHKTAGYSFDSYGESESGFFDSAEHAEYAKEEFREKWDKKYPNIIKSWDKNWAELTTFFEYPQEIRKIIYTTNAVEGYHRMVRKFTKSKSIFPTDDSIRKVIYMSVKEISKKWTMPVRDWGLAYSQFAIFFEDRLAA